VAADERQPDHGPGPGAGNGGAPRAPGVGRGKRRLLWLVLIVALAAGAYVGWYQYRAAGIAQRAGMPAGPEPIHPEAAERARLAEALRGLEDRLQAQERIQEELRAGLQAVQRKLDESPDRPAVVPNRDLWQALEAEELLRLAAQRLWVSRSPVGVLPLLTRSDRLLAELADPGLQPARAALAAEITALKLLDPPDIEGIYLRIGALQEALAMLRPLPQPEPVDSEPAAPGPGASPDGFWKRLLANADAAWRRFSAEHLRVRTLEQPPPALLTAAEEARLRQYLRLLLSQAQLALLDRQANIYRAALDQASQLLATQFGADPRSAAVTAELAELRDRDIAPRLPELGAAREHLREYLLRRTAPLAEREAP
jgi:uroporphyrin-III C-methyltransferase